MKLVLAAVVWSALIATTPRADGLAPVRLGIHVQPVAHVGEKLHASVRVTADPGALDDRFGPLRIEVRLAKECGGDFQHTPGLTLLDKLLSPQPATGRAYSALARGVLRPKSGGREAVCVYLEETGDNRVWAHDESLTVKVVR